MKKELVYINEYRVEIDYSVEENLKSFKEEVLNTLYKNHKEHSVNNLLFSGGNDSTFILKSLQELGINPKLHSLSFSKDNSDIGSLQTKEQCKKFGLQEPEFLYLDKYELYKHIDILTFEKRIAYPALHCYFMDYYLSLMEGEQFFCGMSCEYRYSNGILFLPVAPPAIKFYNPYRLFGYDSSETFLAFVNDPIFKDNYLQENGEIPFWGENVWRIRDLIYNNCYPELQLPSKCPIEADYVSIDYYDQKLKLIKEMHPEIFWMQPFRFNVKEYFDRKNNT